MIDGRAESQLDAELNPEVPTLNYVSLTKLLNKVVEQKSLVLFIKSRISLTFPSLHECLQLKSVCID